MKKQHLPGLRELSLFAIVAVIGSAIASSVGHASREYVMAVVIFPIFLFAAILGLYRSGRLKRIDD